MNCRTTFRVVAITLLLGGSLRSHAQEVWINPFSNNWSNNASWLDGSAPPAGGSTSLSLTFLSSGASIFTATNNLGNPFLLNALIFDTNATGVSTIASAAANDAADTFTILAGNRVTGFFTNAIPSGPSNIGHLVFSGGQFEVTYNSTNVVLSNFVVPEPSVAILLFATVPLTPLRRHRGLSN